MPKGARALRSAWLALACAWTASACGDAGGGGALAAVTDAATDAGPPPGTDAHVDAAGGPADAESLDAEPAADASVPCTADEACGEGAYCEDGACRAAVPPLVPPGDDVFRVGVARFDLAPAYFETWTDRAGPDCAENRAGAYDGPLNAAAATGDRCEDTFDDADGDGRFDAVWLAGAGADRPASGIDEDNPPAGRVLLLERNDTLYLLITLDVYALGPEPLQALVRGLQLRLGIPETRIAVHTVGQRSAPDAVGMWGPTLALAGPALAPLRTLAGTVPVLAHLPVETGLDREWLREIRRRVVVAAQTALTTAAPATARFARSSLAATGPAETPPETTWSVPSADAVARLAAPTYLSHDGRFPLQRDLDVRVLAFDRAEGGTIAVATLWGASPATEGAQTRLSADVAGHTRAALERAFPGALALWLTGASSEEVLAGAGAFVPETDTAGEPGEGPAADSGPALGRLVAATADRALRDAAPLAPTLAITSRYAWLALTNPRWDLAARLGVVPGLADWLLGRRSTPVWSSGTVAPACGGLGCLRYRLDRVDLGPVRLVTTPGGLDEAFVLGREEGTLALTDAESQNLTDLDLDGVVDADDPEIVLPSRQRAAADPVRVAAPLNPQRFAAVAPLAADDVWLAGRTNGGLGSLRANSDVVNVYEGQLSDLQAALVADPALATLDLCLTGYTCEHALSLGALVPQLLLDLPGVLADLPGGHLLALRDAGPEAVEEVGGFRVLGPDEMPRVEGRGLLLGAGPWAFALSADLGLAGTSPGDVLLLDDARRFIIERLAPVVLARHPNAGDSWRGLHAGGGDGVYNTACELLHDGVCPTPRPLAPADDPNATLPRQPETAPSAPPTAPASPAPTDRRSAFAP